MVKQLWILGAGIAALGIAHFARTALRAEAIKRARHEIKHDLRRWEEEGGNVIPPVGSVALPQSSSASSSGH